MCSLEVIAAPASTDQVVTGTITKTTVDETVEALYNAESVIIVVGYGMAVCESAVRHFPDYGTSERERRQCALRYSPSGWPDAGTV